MQTGERVDVYIYVGVCTMVLITLANQNYIHEEIKSRLNLGNACYHAVQSCLSSYLLSKDINNKIYKTIILPVFCMSVKPCL
jgi:hypothetical protein